jgi:hypothetical protein
MLDFFAAGWITENYGARSRWLMWCNPLPGGLMDAYDAGPRALTWVRWVDAIDRPLPRPACTARHMEADSNLLEIATSTTTPQA